jgi:NADH-quinone oxidoreductase subunit G
MTRFGGHGAVVPQSPVAPGSAAAPGAGEAVLASWHELVDAGRMLDGEPALAGTAKPARALLSAATAAEIGVRDGDPLVIGGIGGALTLPTVIADLPDRVVWVPTNSEGTGIRANLGAQPGDLVSLTAAAGVLS